MRKPFFVLRQIKIQAARVKHIADLVQIQTWKTAVLRNIHVPQVGSFRAAVEKFLDNLMVSRIEGIPFDPGSVLPSLPREKDEGVDLAQIGKGQDSSNAFPVFQDQEERSVIEMPLKAETKIPQVGKRFDWNELLPQPLAFFQVRDKTFLEHGAFLPATFLGGSHKRPPSLSGGDVNLDDLRFKKPLCEVCNHFRIVELTTENIQVGCIGEICEMS